MSSDVLGVTDSEIEIEDLNYGSREIRIHITILEGETDRIIAGQGKRSDWALALAALELTKLSILGYIDAAEEEPDPLERLENDPPQLQ